MNIYTMKVALRDKPSIWRTIEMKGNQTLEQLHQAIFKAFDRFDPHLYSFYIGKTIRKAQEYTVLDPGELSGERSAAAARLDKLMLRKGQKFFYLFDFGDMWWHTIKIMSIQEETPKGRYPRIIEKHGQSPPQYPDYEDADEEEEEDDEEEDEDEDEVLFDDEDNEQENLDSLLRDMGSMFVEPDELPVNVPWLEKAESIIKASEKAARAGIKEFSNLWQVVSEEKEYPHTLRRVAFLSFLSAYTHSGARACMNQIMEMHEIDTEAKMDLCGLVAHLKAGPIFMVYSNFDRDNHASISSKKLSGDFRIYFCKNFIIQDLSDAQVQDLMLVYFYPPFLDLPDSMVQDAIRWAGELSGTVKPCVLHYTMKDFPDIAVSPDYVHHVFIGALDLLDVHRELFTREEIENILGRALGHTHFQVRKKGYELAAEFLGIESLQPGLTDRNKIVRNFVQKCIDAGGRPRKKKHGGEQQLLFRKSNGAEEDH